MNKTILRFLLCFVLMTIVAWGWYQPDFVPKKILRLTGQENKERLDKCSMRPPLSKKYGRNETWWIGRLNFGSHLGGNYRYEAALISKRHAIISSEIVNVEEYKQKLLFGRVPTGTGVGCNPEDPQMLEFYSEVQKQPWLIFTTENHIPRSFKWDKALYYDRCKFDSDGFVIREESDGIIVVELSDEVDINIPYVCIPDYDYYSSINKTEAILSVKTVPEKSPITGFYFEYEAQDGMIDRCNDRFCWSPDNQTQDYKEFQKEQRVSMPFLTKDERPLLFGLGVKTIKDEKKFAVTDLGEFLEGLCEHVGVCPENAITTPPPTTTRIPTTTGIPTTIAKTARSTTRRLGSTTDYVPEFLFDEEARDFEEPYFKRNRTRKEGNKREWTFTVVFMILGLLVLE